MKKRICSLVLILVIIFSSTSFTFSTVDVHPFAVKPVQAKYIEKSIDNNQVEAE